jgi:hypothetical protein
MRITSRRAVEQQAFRRIEEIIVGPRRRRAMGDLAALTRSIEELDALIAGARRLAAASCLAGPTWSNLDSVARGELAENVHRKNLTPGELVAIGAEVERIERESADGRQRSQQRRGGLRTLKSK